MGKLKILVLPSDRHGVGKFRSIDQHLRLEELYPEDYIVTISHDFNFDTSEILKYDIIHVHKLPYNDYEHGVELLSKIKKLAVKLIIDIDDYWKLSVKHPQYFLYTNGKRTEAIVEAIRMADYVTTTTPIAADMIRKINKNVVVLPNAIDPNEKQAKIIQTKNDYDLRIGWLGGSNHVADIELMDGLLGRMNEFPKAQLVLCGFDTRGAKIMQNKDTGKVESIPMLPQETDWCKYEKLFTCNYITLKDDPDYSTYLQLYRQQPPYNDINKRYRRIWTKDIKTYLTGYNEFDVLLAPLCEHDYNKFKSQLKIIEAGFFKKAVIAQDYGPYQIDIVDGKNGLLVEPRKNHKEWFKKVKLLVNNPEMVKDLGEALYETVINKYHIDIVTKQRHEFYQTI